MIVSVRLTDMFSADRTRALRPPPHPRHQRGQRHLPPSISARRTRGDDLDTTPRRVTDDSWRGPSPSPSCTRRSTPCNSSSSDSAALTGQGATCDTGRWASATCSCAARTDSLPGRFGGSPPLAHLPPTPSGERGVPTSRAQGLLAVELAASMRQRQLRRADPARGAYRRTGKPTRPDAPWTRNRGEGDTVGDRHDAASARNRHHSRIPRASRSPSLVPPGTHRRAARERTAFADLRPRPGIRAALTSPRRAGSEPPGEIRSS